MIDVPKSGHRLPATSQIKTLFVLLAVAIASLNLAAAQSVTSPPKRISATVTSKVEPVYTPEAKRARLEGQATLKIRIDENGHPQDVTFISFTAQDSEGKAVAVTDPLGLDGAAVAAVKMWRFQPPTREGKAVETIAQVFVYFRL
ncbi:MAG: energy transducer TonB [Bryobacteraceae bacterium]